jgi:hypothetical protein
MIKSMKNLKGPIGNQTRDLPACSAMPQPTVPQYKMRNANKKKKIRGQYESSLRK